MIKPEVSKMRWDEVKQHFPNEWIVLEVTKAHSKGGQRFIEEMSIIDVHEDSTKALRRYSELHQEDPHREYCFFHTSRPEIVARERYVRIRGPRLKIWSDTHDEPSGYQARSETIDTHELGSRLSAL